MSDAKERREIDTDESLTPNIDKLKKILSLFTSSGGETTNISLINRINSGELCVFSQQILRFLGKESNESESEHRKSTKVASHFRVIKEFYVAYQNAGFAASPSMDLFFNSLQIYENVMSIAFVILGDDATALEEINEVVESAISTIKNYTYIGCGALMLCGAIVLRNLSLLFGKIDKLLHGDVGILLKTLAAIGCCALILYGVVVFTDFNSLIRKIDKLIGDLIVDKAIEFFKANIEVFCNFFHIDISRTDTLIQASMLIQAQVKLIADGLRQIMGDAVPKVERAYKWSPLAMTEKIRDNLHKFENESQVVARTMSSFESFFATMQRAERVFENFRPDELLLDAESKSIDNDLLLQESPVDQIKKAGEFFQHLETILVYGVLEFKNEDAVMYPILDELDECTRILNKFLELHIVYKIVCGQNYLSKLSVCISNIVKLIESSHFDLQSPQGVLIKIQEKYPNLIFLLAESFVNESLKKQLDFLPRDVRNIIGGSLNANFQNFDITNKDAIMQAAQGSVHNVIEAASTHLDEINRDDVANTAHDAVENATGINLDTINPDEAVKTAHDAVQNVVESTGINLDAIKENKVVKTTHDAVRNVVQDTATNLNIGDKDAVVRAAENAAKNVLGSATNKFRRFF